MRKDENGNACPETLGEYKKICLAIGGASCRAVKLLQRHIDDSVLGEDEKVVADDTQMRALLMPLLID